VRSSSTMSSAAMPAPSSEEIRSRGTVPISHASDIDAPRGETSASLVRPRPPSRTTSSPSVSFCTSQSTPTRAPIVSPHRGGHLVAPACESERVRRLSEQMKAVCGRDL